MTAAWEQEYQRNTLIEQAPAIIERIEGWLKRRRDDQLRYSDGWHVVDLLLNEVRDKCAQGLLPWEDREECP